MAALVSGTICWLLLPGRFGFAEHLIISYIMFSFTYLAMDWLLIATSTPAEINKYADAEDGRRIYVVAMLMLAAMASIITVLFLVIEKSKLQLKPALFIASTLGALILSWSLIHTIFTLHYARMYYRSKEPTMDIPGTDNPDYFDFAYFAFGIGATFQTADISIKSKKLRKTVLLHSIVSFFINTIIVAITINIIAGLAG